MSRMQYALERYLTVRTAGGGSLSPDGKRLAFITDITGLPQAWVVDADGGWPSQITFTRDAVRQVSWSPAGDWILFVMDADGNERMQLHLVRPDGSEVRPLTEQPESIFSFGDWSADGRHITWSANTRDPRFFDVYVMDIATGESRCIHRSDGNNYALNFSPDGATVLFQRSHGSFDYDLYTVPADGDPDAEPRHLTPHEGPAVFARPCWRPDASGLWLLTDLGGDFIHLATLDLETLELAPLLREEWDLEELTARSVTLAATVNAGGRSELRVIDGVTGQVTARHELDGVAAGLEFAAAADRLGYTFTGPRDNGDVWVMDLGGAPWQATRSDRGGIPRDTLVSPDLVAYPTFDGRDIPAWFYLPEGARPGDDLPAVIHIHGGPESQTRTPFSGVFQYLLSRGFAILAPNVRGSTGYGRSYHMLDNGRKRLDSVADAAAAVDWLKACGYVDPDRIACVGGSYGGFMVLALVTRYPDLWAAGVDLFGIANFETFFKNTGPYRRKLRASEYGDPEKDADFLRDISPIHAVDAITAPMLIIAGATDPRVPKDESDQIADSLRRRDVPVEYLVFDDEGHGIVKLENKLQAYGTMTAFLEQYLK